MPTRSRCCRPRRASTRFVARWRNCSTPPTAFRASRATATGSTTSGRTPTQQARPVAAHHAGRVPQAGHPLGNRARPRRAGRGRRRELGLGRCQLPGSAGPPLPHLAVARRRRCEGGARVRHRRPRRSSKDGFTLPEAKSDVEWIDADTVYVGTDFGPGSLTEFGLSAHHQTLEARHAAEPRRSRCSKARSRTSGPAVAVDRTPGFERTMFVRAPDFYTQERFLLQGDRLVPTRSASRCAGEVHAQRGHAGRHAADRAAQRAARRRRAHLPQRRAAGHRRTHAAPAASGASRCCSSPRPRARSPVSPPRAATCIVNVLDNVASRLEEWRRTPKGFVRREIEAPFPGTLVVRQPARPDARTTTRWPSATRCATPTSSPPTRCSWAAPAATGASRSRRCSPAFDASGMRAEQFFAASRRRHARALLRRLARAAPRPTAATRRCSTATAASEIAARAVVLARFRQRLVQARRRAGGGQHPRRRRVRAGVAPGRGQGQQAAQLRRLHRRGRRPDRPQDHQPAPPRHRRRQQRRAAGRRGVHAAPRTVQRRRLPGAPARHEALPQAAGRR